MKAMNCSQIARIWECIGGLRGHRVANIGAFAEEQGASRDSFVLVRAKRADSKNFYSLGDAVRKLSHASGVVEDPSIEKGRNIAIFRQTAEDRQILGRRVAVEQQLVARGQELCDDSNHPLLVFAEFPLFCAG